MSFDHFSQQLRTMHHHFRCADFMYLFAWHFLCPLETIRKYSLFYCYDYCYCYMFDFSLPHLQLLTFFSINIHQLVFNGGRNKRGILRDRFTMSTLQYWLNA